MNGNTIITIGREYGSGGREIGQKLAQRLGVSFYDKELIAIAAKESGMSKELFEGLDEKPTNSLLYSLSTGMYMMGGPVSPMMEAPLNDRIFGIQTKIIRELAAKGGCVFIGRCADYVLREDPDGVHVFLHAPLAYRTQRISRAYQISEEKAEDSIRKMDKRRASYYNFYTGQKWSDCKNYHLTIDTSIGADQTVDLIESYLNIKAK